MTEQKTNNYSGELHRRMTELLTAILKFKKERVYAPSSIELAKRMYISQAECSTRIQEAEALGLLTKEWKQARTLGLRGEGYSAPVWERDVGNYVKYFLKGAAENE